MALWVVLGMPFLGAQEPPTIQSCDSLFACLTGPTYELCVTIDVDSNYNKPIDFFSIEWGDGTIDTIQGSTNPPNQFHIYDLSGFFNDPCQNASNFEEVDVKLKTFLTNTNLPDNNSFTMTFMNPPEAFFTLSTPLICEEDEVDFNNSTCPQNDHEIINWNYGDGTNGLDDFHQYADAGTYQVILEVENKCGSDTYSETLEVIQPTEAIAEAFQGIDGQMGDTLILCLGTGNTVGLSGLASPGANVFQWEVFPSTGTNWLPDTINNPEQLPEPFLTLTEGGILYQVILEADNECNDPDRDTLLIKVEAEDGLVLENQQDVCDSLWYTPSPLNMEAIYEVDGALVDPGSFPVLLGEGSHEISATLSNACGMQILTDQFEVLMRTTAQIDGQDTISTCISEDTVALMANPTGGDWIGGICINATGIVDLHCLGGGIYSFIYGSECIDPDTVWVEIEADTTGISLSPQPDECISLEYQPMPLFNSASYSLNAAPINNFPQNLDTGTYVVSASFSNECVNQLLADTFLVAPPDVAEIQGSDTINLCLSEDTISLDAQPAANGVWSGTSCVNIQGIVDIPCLGAGMHPIIYGDECTLPDTVWLIVEDNLVSFTHPTVAYCALDTTVFSFEANIPGGVFQGPGMISGSGNLFEPALAGPGEHVITYQIEDTTQLCPVLDSFTVQVFALDGMFEVVGCDGLTVFFEAANTSDFDSVTWDFGDGGMAVGENTQHTFSSAQSYEVSMQLSLDGCIYTYRDTVEVQEPPNVAVELFSSGPCSPVTISFQNNSMGTELAYQWDFGNGTMSTDSSPTPVTFVSAVDTFFIIQLEISNDCGSDFWNDTIFVGALPNASFSSLTDEYCSGEEVDLGQNSTGTITGYEWILPTGQVLQGLPEPTPTFFTGDQSDTVDVLLVVSNGCGTDTATKRVIIHPANVNAFFNIDKLEVCQGTPICLENFSTPGASILFELGDGNTTTADSFCYTFADSGIYTVNLYAFGCGFDSLSAEVQVLPAPTLAVDIPSAACAGQTVVYSLVTSGLGERWLAFGTGDTTFFQTGAYMYDSSGTYMWRAYSSSIAGCASSQMGNIEIVPSPQAAFAVQDSLCQNTPASFSNMSMNSQTCAWSFGDGNLSADCNPVHLYDGPGQKWVTLLVSNSIGCIDSSVQSVYIRPIPTAGFIVDTLAICPPAEFQFQDASLDRTSLSWTFGNGNQSSLTNPIVVFPSGGIYRVIQIAEDVYCRDTFGFDLSVPPTPELSFEVEDEKCFGDENGSIAIEQGSGFESELWGEDYYQFGIDLYEGLSPGNYELRIFSEAGCDTSYPITINDKAPFLLDIADEEVTLFLGDSTIQEVYTNSSAIADFSWFPMDGVQAPELSPVTIQPSETNWYTIRAWDEDGCLASDSILLRVDKDRQIFLPNVFSPNGDGINDIFFPSGRLIKEIVSFQVFDRWGELLFERRYFPPNDATMGWDGQFKGKPVLSGVYVYKVVVRFEKPDSVVETIEGDITIVR